MNIFYALKEFIDRFSFRQEQVRAPQSSGSLALSTFSLLVVHIILSIIKLFLLVILGNLLFALLHSPILVLLPTMRRHRFRQFELFKFAHARLLQLQLSRLLFSHFSFITTLRELVKTLMLIEAQEPPLLDCDFANKHTILCKS